MSVVAHRHYSWARGSILLLSLAPLSTMKASSQGGGLQARFKALFLQVVYLKYVVFSAIGIDVQFLGGNLGQQQQHMLF